MNINEMLACPNVTISVTAADLKEFALEVIEEVKQATEAKAEAENAANRRYSLEEAAQYLGRTKATLWRWRKTDYLKPDGYLGVKPFYFKKSLDKISGNAAV